MQALAAAAHECRIDMYKGRICAIVMFYVVPYIYSNILRLFLLNRKHICLCLFSFSGLVFFFFFLSCMLILVVVFMGMHVRVKGQPRCFSDTLYLFLKTGSLVRLRLSWLCQPAFLYCPSSEITSGTCHHAWLFFF